MLAGKQGAINSAQRVREDFKKKVTLALKKAAEAWGCGAGGAGERPSEQRERGLKARWCGCV